LPPAFRAGNWGCSCGQPISADTVAARVSMRAAIAVDQRFGGARLRLRVVEQQSRIVEQRALVALQRQRVVALLLDDLRGDGALGS